MGLTTNDIVTTLIAMGYDSAMVAGTLRGAMLADTSAEGLIGAYLTTRLGVPTAVERIKIDSDVVGEPGTWQLTITTNIIAVTVEVPPVLQFMQDFDRGTYPQLVLVP